MIVVGMLSGTSMDGLDTAVCEIEVDDAGARLTVLGHHDAPWPADLQERLLAVLPPATTTVGEIAALDNAIGRAAGAAAGAALELTWHGVPGVRSGATGARTARVLGRISPGYAPLRLPEPVGAVHALQIVARGEDPVAPPAPGFPSHGSWVGV